MGMTGGVGGVNVNLSPATGLAVGERKEKGVDGVCIRSSKYIPMDATHNSSYSEEEKHLPLIPQCT